MCVCVCNTVDTDVLCISLKLPTRVSLPVDARRCYCCLCCLDLRKHFFLISLLLNMNAHLAEDHTVRYGFFLFLYIFVRAVRAFGFIYKMITFLLHSPSARFKYFWQKCSCTNITLHLSAYCKTCLIIFSCIRSVFLLQGGRGGDADGALAAVAHVMWSTQSRRARPHS